MIAATRAMGKPLFRGARSRTGPPQRLRGCTASRAIRVAFAASPCLHIKSTLKKFLDASKSVAAEPVFIYREAEVTSSDYCQQPTSTSAFSSSCFVAGESGIRPQCARTIVTITTRSEIMTTSFTSFPCGASQIGGRPTNHHRRVALASTAPGVRMPSAFAILFDSVYDFEPANVAGRSDRDAC